MEYMMLRAPNKPKKHDSSNAFLLADCHLNPTLFIRDLSMPGNIPQLLIDIDLLNYCDTTNICSRLLVSGEEMLCTEGERSLRMVGRMAT